MPDPLAVVPKRAVDLQRTAGRDAPRNSFLSGLIIRVFGLLFSSARTVSLVTDGAATTSSRTGGCAATSGFVASVCSRSCGQAVSGCRRVSWAMFRTEQPAVSNSVTAAIFRERFIRASCFGG